MADPDTTLAAGGQVEATIDTAQLRRLVVEADDLRQVEVTLRVERRNAPAEVLAGGRVVPGSSLELAGLPLSGEGKGIVRLEAGEELVLAAWRNRWHYSGGAELQNFAVRGEGGAAELPDLRASRVGQTPLGRFRATGLSARNTLLEGVVRGELEPRAGRTRGVWYLEGKKGTRLRQADGGVRFETNGRAENGDAYNWTPALVFAPDRSGWYRLSGRWTFSSSQDSEVGRTESMTYTVLKRPRTQGGRVGGATVQLVDRATGITLATAQPAEGRLTFDLDTALLAGWLGDGGARRNVSLAWAVEDGAGASDALLRLRNGDDQVVLRRHETHRLFDWPVRPRDGIYARADGSRLMYGDQRLRLWGVAGTGGESPATADRVARMGFNAFRLWTWGKSRLGGSIFYDAESGPRGEVRDYGEMLNGRPDPLMMYHRYFAACKEAGLFLMSPLLLATVPEDKLLEDGSFVSGGDDWEAWRQAMRNRKNAKGWRVWLSFDERLIAAQKRHIENVLNLENPVTGRRYADEEAIAIWELQNERQLVKLALERGFETWPAYFRQKLTARWNRWLADRYGSDAALRRAWGDLEPGERLRSGSVTLAPVLGQRKDYPATRSIDVVRFLTETVGGFYEGLEAHARAQGKPGVGVSVVPFSYDTQYRMNLPWLYSAAGHANLGTFGMYFWTLTSSLSRDPGLYVMDTLSLADKPTVIYETNAGKPNPYRGEYPFIHAAFASHQDWDAVFWHYYHGRYEPEDEAYLARAVPMGRESFFWSATELERDPLMLANLAIAGQLFMNPHLPVAEDPAVVEIGGGAIFDLDYYGEPDLGPLAFERGAGVRFRPEESFTFRPPLGDPDRAYRQGRDDIDFDADNGRLVIDTPTAKVYVGPPVKRFRFRDGVVIGDFTTDWVTFALVSTDGKPIVADGDASSEGARELLVSVRRNSHNTGLEIDRRGVTPGGRFISPNELIERTTNPGTTPVIDMPVGYALWLPFEAEGRVTGYDFATRRIAQHALSGGNYRHDGTPWFVGRIELSDRGRPVEPPAADGTRFPAAEAAESTASAESIDGPELTTVIPGLWSPLPGVAWGQTTEGFMQLAEDQRWSISASSGRDVVNTAGLEVLGLGLADVQWRFAHGRLVGATVAYRSAPVTREAVAVLSDSLGEPESINLSENPFDLSRVEWSITAGGVALRVRMLATQGNLSVESSIQP